MPNTPWSGDFSSSLTYSNARIGNIIASAIERSQPNGFKNPRPPGYALYLIVEASYAAYAISSPRICRLPTSYHSYSKSFPLA